MTGMHDIVTLSLINKDFLYTIIHHCSSLFSTLTIATTLTDLVVNLTENNLIFLKDILWGTQEW